jgi:DNA-binding transcriptional LysR family regulator
MRDWDDARLFLAVARRGTSRAAAKQLGLNQSTISRRLARLETDAGVRLFERRSKRLHLTDAGREAMAVAARIEEQFALLDRQVLGRDARLSGSICVTLPDFMITPLCPMLAAFRRRHPQIELELVMDNEYVSLTHRHADVAVRLGRAVPEHLVGRRIATMGVGVYGATTYVDACNAPEDLASHDWVRWGEQWRDIPPERWIDKHVAAERIAARVNTNAAHIELIAAGFGVGFQPCYRAEGDPRLRCLARQTEFDLSLWILTHEDIRATARVRAFMSTIGDALARDRPRIEGPALGPSPAAGAG